MVEENTEELDKLPKGFVKLTYQEGQPAIVTRGEHNELTTQVVESHVPLTQALIRQAGDKHRGAFRLLEEYDRRGGR